MEIVRDIGAKISLIHQTAKQEAINPLNAELNPICHLLALLGGATIVVVSRLRVNLHFRVMQASGFCADTSTRLFFDADDQRQRIFAVSRRSKSVVTTN